MGNISMYAYGKDYHTIVEALLMEIAEFIHTKYPEAKTSIHVDKGEGNDKMAAYDAGLGFIGKNSLLINEQYGSYVFIGYLETDLVLPPDSPVETACLACGKCEQSCPGGAIENGKITVEKCASHLSQKRGELSDDEREIIKKSGLIWGCDVCQSVCPHNQALPLSPIATFHEDLIFNLGPMNMTNKAFYDLYENRAFSWRGKAVLNRNLEILSRHKNRNEGHSN